MRHGETHGREARALIDDAGDHLPQRHLPFTGCAQGLFEPQASRDLVYGPYSPKRQPLPQSDRILESPQVLQVLLVAQSQAERLDLRRRTLTDIRNGTMEDLAMGAIGLAQQMPHIRFATTSDVRGIDIYSGCYCSL